jgi:hypothetical protein
MWDYRGRLPVAGRRTSSDRLSATYKGRIVQRNKALGVAAPDTNNRESAVYGSEHQLMPCIRDVPPVGGEPFDDKAGKRRLQLRKQDYLDFVPNLSARPRAQKNKDWQQAAALIGELNHRYHDVFGEWIDRNRAGLP